MTERRWIRHLVSKVQPEGGRLTKIERLAALLSVGCRSVPYGFSVSTPAECLAQDVVLEHSPDDTIGCKACANLAELVWLGFSGADVGEPESWNAYRTATPSHVDRWLAGCNVIPDPDIVRELLAVNAQAS